MSTSVGPLSSLSPGLPGGISAALGINAPAVVKALPGICARISVTTVGSAGNLTLNDAATTGGASASNQIFSAAFGSLTPVIELDWPCGTGIVVSSVPTGGVVSIAFT